jgi:rubredoxin
LSLTGIGAGSRIAPGVGGTLPSVAKPDRCPECGSDELRPTTRHHSLQGNVEAWVCGVCDWSSNPLIGRPAADRSKNVTLRRLLASSQPPKRDPDAKGED